jgi:hypothetical protein
MPDGAADAVPPNAALGSAPPWISGPYPAISTMEAFM